MSAAILGIVWFVCLLISVFLVLEFVGNLHLVSMFREGKKWWMWPGRIVALAIFAAVVHFHPF